MRIRWFIWFEFWEHWTDPLGKMYNIRIDSGQVRLAAANAPADESDKLGAANKRTAWVTAASVDAAIDSASAEVQVFVDVGRVLRIELLAALVWENFQIGRMKSIRKSCIAQNPIRGLVCCSPAKDLALTASCIPIRQKFCYSLGCKFLENGFLGNEIMLMNYFKFSYILENLANLYPDNSYRRVLDNLIFENNYGNVI